MHSPFAFRTRCLSLNLGATASTSEARPRKVVAKLVASGHLPMNTCPEVGASTLRFGSTQRLHVATDRQV